MNGYDQHSSRFARGGRVTVAEASGDTRSDGKSSQTKDGANRYDTSTPERRRKALAAARRSGNPADEARVRKQISSEANSTIDMLMLQQIARRDNRARKRGGYRSPSLVVEVEGKEMDEAKGELPPWLRKDGDSAPDGKKPKRGKVAESVLNPQIKPRDVVGRDDLGEAVLAPKKRPLADDEDDTTDPL